MIAVLGETTGCLAAKQIQDKMLKHPEGSSILRYVFIVLYVRNIKYLLIMPLF